MFAKKFLSIVGLLFLGSQITSVYGTCTITIGETLTTCSKKEGDCNDGYYVVFPTVDDDYTANEGGKSDGKLIELTDTQSNCYIRSDVGYIGYFKSGETNKYISNSYENKANLVTDGEGCTAGQVDSNDDYKFCLDSRTKKVTWNDDKVYLFKDVNSIFGNDANKEYLVTSATGTNKIVVKTGFDGKSGVEADDYCVTSEGIIVKRGNGFCDNECDSYINCDGNGDCRAITYKTTRADSCNPSSSTDKENCTKGYYLMVANTPDTTFTNSAVEGVLWKCNDDAGDCNYVPAAQIPYGYLMNIGQTNYPYIFCDGNGTSGTCTAIAKGSLTVSETAFGDCSGKQIGDLMEYQGAYKLCIASGKPVTLGSGAAVVKYFMGYDESATNVFASKMADGFYFMVDIQIGGNDILLHDYEGEAEKYKYTDVDQKVYEKTDTTTTICTGTNSIIEFTKDYKEGDEVDYYVAGAATDGPNKA